MLSTLTTAACTHAAPPRSASPDVGVTQPTAATLAPRARARLGEHEGEREDGAPLKVHDRGRTVFAYAPTEPFAERPAAIYLNGVCGRPTKGCPHFRDGVTPHGWLVCPTANQACPSGGASWRGSTSTKREVVEDAVQMVARAFPGQLDTTTRTVLIGFSQGAYVALDLARAEPGKYQALLLIGAFVENTTADELRRAGVTRVVLAAGDQDASSRSMARAAAALANGGLSVRFVSLGHVGHTYVADDAHRAALTTALEWLEGERIESADGAMPSALSAQR